MADKQEKCAHPSCNCTAVQDSKFYSAVCEGNAGRADTICGCNHPQCKVAV